MKRKVIFHIISHLDLGGAERVAVNISKSQNSNFEYHIVEVVKGSSEFSISLKKELELSNVQYHCSPFSKNKFAICLFWSWFLPVYLKYEPSVIHSHTEVPDFALWLFRKISWLFFWVRPHYVRTIHNTQLWNDWGKLGNMVEKFYIKHHCNVAISKNTQKSYQQKYGGELPPIINNGIEVGKQEVFEGIKEGKINVLFAGRLEYQKGIDELIAIVLALKDDDRFQFTIIGDGSMKEKLHIACAGLKNVTLFDKIFGLHKYLSSFDYLFMPSNHEGLGLIAVEAMMAHTLPIINLCAGLDETVPEDWSLAVCDNNVDDFLKIFNNLPSYDNYRELTQKAYDFSLSHFSMSKMQSEYENQYRTITG